MILQALTRHYEDLLALGRIPRPGWTTAKVSYALALDGDGRVIQLLHLNQQVRHGKKTVWSPRNCRCQPLQNALLASLQIFCATTAVIFWELTARGTPPIPPITFPPLKLCIFPC